MKNLLIFSFFLLLFMDNAYSQCRTRTWNSCEISVNGKPPVSYNCISFRFWHDANIVISDEWWVMSVFEYFVSKIFSLFLQYDTTTISQKRRHCWCLLYGTKNFYGRNSISCWYSKKLGFECCHWRYDWISQKISIIFVT